MARERDRDERGTLVALMFGAAATLLIALGVLIGMIAALF